MCAASRRTSRRCRTCSSTRAAASRSSPSTPRRSGIDTAAEGAFVADALFTTLTNVDFDAESVAGKVDEAVALREALKASVARCRRRRRVRRRCSQRSPRPTTVEGKIAQGREFGSPWDTTRDADVQSLQETTLYGMKGVGAYEHHARALGQTDPAIYSYLFKALAAHERHESSTSNDWVGLALECGAVNLRTMEILDAANTGTYGHPTPTKVPLGQRSGQGDPHLRPRPRRPQGAARGRPRAPASTSTRTARCCPAHAYPELQEVRAPRRPLRHRVAEPAQGVRASSPAPS